MISEICGNVRAGWSTGEKLLNNGALLSTKEGKEELERELNEIPDIFFQNDFDLTHSDTFVELLKIT